MKRLLPLAALAVFPLIALRADAPRVYAIRGARIVTAAGAPIESGTIVMRQGVIESVSATAATPTDAVVIEGAGLTVYPGLIDLGNTRAAEQPTPPQPQNVRTTAELERWKRALILKPQARGRCRQSRRCRTDEARLVRGDVGAGAAMG